MNSASECGTGQPSVANTDLRAAEATGYLHPHYAESLRQFGEPRHLPRADGWILQRPISGSSSRDAMGAYPLFCCRNWASLKKDLDALREEIVSLVVVADPFANESRKSLAQAFVDFTEPFKEHFIADLQLPVTATVSRHHQYYARKALRDVTIEVCARPAEMVDDWCELYAAVVKRHNLRGVQAFSREAFVKQLAVPGVVAFRALHAGKAIAAHLWYVQGEIAYSHLAAAGDEGYRMMASYGLYWSAMSYFAGRVRWIDWGGGAGISAPSPGLANFKRGWASETRFSYLCGRIFDRAEYERLVRETGTSGASYFPRYRAAKGN